MDTIFDYVLTYVLLVAGFFLCYASVYLKRPARALNGFIWGALGGLTFTWVLATFSSSVEEFEQCYLTVMLVVGGIIALINALSEGAGLFFGAICLAPFIGICGRMAIYGTYMDSGSYKRLFFVALAAGFFAGCFLAANKTAGSLILSSLTGAFSVSIAAWGYMEHEDVINLLRIFLNGGMRQKQGMLICMAVLFVTGCMLQGRILLNQKNPAKIPANADGSYGWADLTWKHHLMILLTLALFVLKEVLPSMAPALAGPFADGGYPMLAAAGLYVGGIVFFTWNFAGAVSFFYQMWYLLWIPFELLFGRTQRLSASPETLVFDILKYFIFWVFVLLLKKSTGMGNGGIALALLLGAFLYPAGTEFLKTGVFPEKILTADNAVLWLSMLAGVILFTLIGNPETARTGGRRFAYQKGSARYCRSCGERRKIGHKYCTHCGLEYRT